jgi:ABC-2 type transport system permease protein
MAAEVGVSTLRKIANIAWLNLLQLVKDRAGLVTLIAIPLMLTFLFGTMLGGAESKVPVAVADLDRTAYSRQIVSGLDPASYRISDVSESEARAMTSSGEVAAAIIIGKGLGGDVLGGTDTTVTVVEDPRSTSALAVAEAVRGGVQRVAANAEVIRIVQGAFRDASTMTGVQQAPPAPSDVFAYADRLWSPQPPLSVNAVSVTASKVRGTATEAVGFQQYSLGFTLMFMLFMGIGAAGGFLDEREQGTLSRLLTTPTSKVVLVGGKVAGIYITVALEAAIMIGAGVAIFHVPWGDDPVGVVMIIGAYALAATGLGVMASSLVRTRGQLSAITAVGATALAMLGGCYWPLDIVNPTMRTIAYMTPTGWAMTGLTDVVVRFQGTAHAVVPTLVLVGFAAVFLGVGVARLKLE